MTTEQQTRTRIEIERAVSEAHAAADIVLRATAVQPNVMDAANIVANSISRACALREMLDELTHEIG